MYEGLIGIDVFGPMDAFVVANLDVPNKPGTGAPLLEGLAARTPLSPPRYSVEVVSTSRGATPMMSGTKLLADAHFADVRGDIDTLVVCGGLGWRGAARPEFLAWLRLKARRSRRVASICLGAFLLAEAGLLDGRRATTHWGFTGELARAYPKVRVEPDAIFVRDGNVYTSAGMTCGMDLALALIEEDEGRDVALAAAREMVLYLKRPGGQTQHSAQLAAQQIPPGRIHTIAEWIVDNLTADLSADALATRAAMSLRNFSRVFSEEAGTTPAKYVERARLEAARRILETTAHSLEEVASAVGFSSAERMRRAFTRHMRVTPQEYRERFQTSWAS